MFYYKNIDNTAFYSLSSEAEDKSLIEISETEFIENTKLPEITEEDLARYRQMQEKENRISELKSLLAKTDYQAIKFAEGELSAEDYAEMKEQRRLWRIEINQLSVD